MTDPTQLPELPDVRQDPIEHFRFMHALAITGSVEAAATILLDNFSVDLDDCTEQFRQFLTGCETAQRRGNGRFEAPWALTEADRSRSMINGGAAQHFVRVDTVDGVTMLRTWRAGMPLPIEPKSEPVPPPINPHKPHAARFDAVTGERIK